MKTPSRIPERIALFDKMANNIMEQAHEQFPDRAELKRPNTAKSPREKRVFRCTIEYLVEEDYLRYVGGPDAAPHGWVRLTHKGLRICASGKLPRIIW